MMRYALVLVATLVVGLGAPSSAHAQTGQQPDSIVSPADTAVVELVLRREVFTYPSFERRNPFVPLTSVDAGPRFDQMQLTGIMFDELDPAASIAVIAADVTRSGTAAPAAAPEGGAEQPVFTGQVRRLRAGERWGNVRVVRVEAERVVVDVNNFGVVESRVMALDSRGQGGS